MPSHYERYGRQWYLDNKGRLLARAKERYHKNGDKHRKRGREYYKERKARSPEKYRGYHLQQYGISQLDYERLLADQDGACAICGNVWWGLLMVDHDHSTGEVRGLLCRDCNLALGQFGDSIDRMRRAIEYLRSRI